VHIEWLPWSKIPDLSTAWEIVRRADQPNGGLNVDAWHVVRSGTDLDELRRVPGPRILGIQLDDGPIAAEEDLVTATLHGRAVPGEGEFDLVAILGALADTGTTAPVGVEVFSDALHRLDPGEAARRAAVATRALLGDVRGAVRGAVR
jgi:sugar phosphate isomerase/epimerase